MGGGEPGRYVRIDVDLAEDGRAAPDQDHELRLRLQVAREIVPGRGDVGDVLIPARGGRRAAHAPPDGDARVWGVAPRERLEHELVTGQHVGVDGRVRRAPGADLVAGQLQQLSPPLSPAPARGSRPAL